MNLLKNFILFFTVIILSCDVQAAGIDTAMIDAKNRWVDSVYRSLTPEQRIAQLMVIRAWSWKDSVYQDSLATIVRRFNPGGICFFKGTPRRQALLTNQLQEAAQTPLLIVTDAEWGLGMRLDSAFAFPRNITLGALQDDSVLFRISKQIARDCRRLGVHVNLAPVVDVNNNPLNPVIGYRSFGEDPRLVARKGTVYLSGHQSEGIPATAKHFPGHGDTGSDSHIDLPLIPHPRQRMDSVELLPFRELIRHGVESIMIAHLYVPAFDSTANTAATLSPRIVHELLKTEMGFGGFVISDALDMQGVTKYCKPGQIETLALLAGNDILLLPQDMEIAIKAIKAAADSTLIPDSLIEKKVRHILELKYNTGAAYRKKVDILHLYEDLNPVVSSVLERQVYEGAITLVRDPFGMIPLRYLDRRKIASLVMGDSLPSQFQERLGEYAPVTPFYLPARFGPKDADSIVHLLSPFDVIVMGILSVKSNPEIDFGITPEMVALLDTLSRTHRTILVDFGTPYALSILDSLSLPESIIVAYQNNPPSQEKAAELVFGGLPFTGRLPVSAAGFHASTGLQTQTCRLSHILPEEIGIPRSELVALDSLIESGISSKAYPGCQVLFAWRGKVFYNKSFGHPTYRDTIAVNNDCIYDLASVTKIMATTLAVMKLDEEEKLHPDDSLGKFLPFLAGTDKASLTLRQVMTHQAGLQPWIRFYEVPGISRDSIFRMIAVSPLLPRKEYKYSDLGFYLLKVIVEELTGKSFEQYLDQAYYRPLGLKTTGFNPLTRFDISRIMPTEVDSAFRGGMVRGVVHDQGAYLLNGVSGHAGLFSNASDLAVILQMLLDCGTYGEKQYLLPETIDTYTRTQFPDNGNRRGIGFDKPTLIPIPDGPVCKGASPSSYGHSGFTGTYVWADPEHDLIYIFLSNRIYPDASNNRLSELNLRTRIHQKMYDIISQYHLK